MIIRPACKRDYTPLPNSILADRRLSADTRLMIIWLLSKPRTWELRPVFLLVSYHIRTRNRSDKSERQE